ncbi:hypothetical protein OG762_45360 [Streptomyces sp. NBC_01136]|uniref:hypothetical protein n=1 Tax=unclassified Streptomyces TaxID=2593676 RepID=UPI0032522945|nr:hypothetical protein OG762_45360 [Streptomyces sp. NBC_01136]
MANPSEAAGDLTFAFAREVARVTPRGKVTILATPPPTISGTAVVSGVVRAPDDTLYVNYNADAESGIRRLDPHGGAPEQVGGFGPFRRHVVSGAGTGLPTVYAFLSCAVTAATRLPW